MMKDPLVNRILDKNLGSCYQYLTDDEINSEKNYILFSAMNSFKPGKSSFLKWLSTLSGFYSKSRYRTIIRNQVYRPLVDKEVEKDNSVRQTLLDLSPIHRKVLVLKFFGNYNNSEIGHILNIRQDEVKNVIAAAKNQFIECYD